MWLLSDLIHILGIPIMCNSTHDISMSLSSQLTAWVIELSVFKTRIFLWDYHLIPHVSLVLNYPSIQCNEISSVTHWYALLSSVWYHIYVQYGSYSPILRMAVCMENPQMDGQLIQTANRTQQHKNQLWIHNDCKSRTSVAPSGSRGWGQLHHITSKSLTKW